MGLKVLSLFDGIGCGRQALKDLNVDVELYHAFEIDKYASAICRYNHPDVEHMGDVNGWKSEPKVLYTEYDLILAGSPCQSFSFAGDQLAFDDERGQLFFTFADIVEYVQIWSNTNVKFLLENVQMSAKNMQVITDRLGVEPVRLNSCLVSAQNRNRLYWANFLITRPYDTDCHLSDVLFDYPATDMDLSEKALDYMNRKVADGRDHWDFAHHSDTMYQKSAAVVANFRKGVPYNVLVMRNADNLPERVRHFHPVECERLQTLPDSYTAGGTFADGSRKSISKTQRLKAIGNGWTVKMISHILGGFSA